MERTTYFYKLPEYVTVSGRRVRINSDFRAGVEFELMLLAGERELSRLLSVWFKGRIKHPAEYFNAAVIFFNLGREPEAETGGDAKRVYDFSRDSGLIHAAFMSCYGIDLSTAKMHWWMFRSLMLHLPAECEFRRAAAIRAANENEFTPDERKRLSELKRIYAIEPEKHESMEARNGRWLGKIAREYEKCERRV